MENSKDVKLEQKNEKSGNSKNTLIVILIILLLGVIGLFIWQLTKSQDQQTKIIVQEKTIKQAATEKDSLQKDFESLLSDYNNIKTDNQALQQQLEADKQQITEYLAQIKTMEVKASQVAFFKKQIAEMKRNRDKLTGQIDSLTQANKVLYDENTQIKGEVQKTQGENQALNEKVSRGAKVKGINCVAEPLNEKGKPNFKSKKVATIKICITLTDNEIAASGSKMVYARIVKPGGDILFNNTENLFESNGQQIAFSTKTEIDYQNKATMVCLSYGAKEGELVPGVYDIEVYTDGDKIGTTSLMLK